MNAHIDPLTAALESLHRAPLTPWAHHRFRTLVAREIKQDGTIDYEVAGKVFAGIPKNYTPPAAFLEALRVTFARDGIQARPAAFDDDHGREVVR